MMAGPPPVPAWLATLRARFTGLNPAVARHARIVQALPLGPGSRLLVVEFDGRHLLVGQARNGLTRLDAAEIAP
ncbi:MAG: Flagellar biosynthesis protein FliO [Pseudomonadota bacterium]|jgi:hypothetical protein